MAIRRGPARLGQVIELTNDVVLRYDDHANWPSLSDLFFHPSFYGWLEGPVQDALDSF